MHKIISNARTQRAVRLVDLGGERAEELVLLLDGLEAAVAVLGRGVDELDVEGLQMGSLGHRQQTLAQSDGALAGSGDAALDHEPVLVDLAVVREATHGGDALLGEVRLGGGGLGVALLADAQHSLVDLGTVVVTLLTSSGDAHRDTSRVPRANTGDLAETSVGLAGKTGNAPTRHNTGISVTTGGRADVQDLALGEDLGDLNLLFEQVLGEIDLSSDVTTVDLDLQKVGDLLSESQLSDLGVGKDAHNLAVLLDAVQLSLVLKRLLGGLLGVLGESLLLGAVPVLVESALDLIGKMGGPDGGQSAKTVRSGNVANNSDHNHGRSLKNGDRLNGLLLVQFGTRSLNLSDNVSHSSLVANEGSQVRSGSLIVLRE